MYKDEYHPRVKKDLRKLDVRTRELIKTTHIPAILSDPSVGQTLVGNLAGIHSYRLKIANQQYRIAYQMNRIAYLTEQPVPRMNLPLI
jgi:mRNA-degrading endonuclease RelE of RelBE toxin-antitoxin system